MERWVEGEDSAAEREEREMTSNKGGEYCHHSLVGGESEVEDGCEGVMEGGGSAAERGGRERRHKI